MRRDFALHVLEGTVKVSVFLGFYEFVVTSNGLSKIFSIDPRFLSSLFERSAFNKERTFRLVLNTYQRLRGKHLFREGVCKNLSKSLHP